MEKKPYVMNMILHQIIYPMILKISIYSGWDCIMNKGRRIWR